MTILITSYTHSKITALTLGNRLTSSSYFGSYFTCICYISQKTPSHTKLYTLKEWWNILVAKQKGNCTSWSHAYLWRTATHECLTPLSFSSSRAAWQGLNSIQVNSLFQHHKLDSSRVLTKQNLSFCALRLCTFFQDSHHYLDREAKL